MTTNARRLLLWSPRLLGILVALFLALFALDVFSEGRGLVQTLLAFLMHVLPSLVLLAVVMLSFRWEWVGGVVFVASGFLYAWMAREHPGWILTIGGPLLLVGVLFLVAWRYHRELHGGEVTAHGTRIRY